MRTLDERDLNRALLARQLLLERVPLPIEDALERMGGIQAQYAPSGYVGLWSRVAGFARDDLTRALEERRVIQATLMRTTIHLVARRDFWLYAVGVRRARRDWSLRTRGTAANAEGEGAMEARAEAMRAALATGPRTVRDLGPLGAGFVGNLGLWVDLVRVPPSGTWERRRADRLALAEDWVGLEDATEPEGRRHLVGAYLRGFGPAPLRDIASWAGLNASDVREAAATLDLVSYRAATGGPTLVDLPDAPLPDRDTPAPVRFLAHWDAALLTHARRTGLLPEPYRPHFFSSRTPFSFGALLVDGRVVGRWSARDGTIHVETFEPLPRPDADAVEAERRALEDFHA